MFKSLRTQNSKFKILRQRRIRLGRKRSKFKTFYLPAKLSLARQAGFLIALLTFAFLLLPFAPTEQVLASNFTDDYLRLGSQNANTTLSGTVCANPSSAGAGTENKILVTFPSDFTISSTLSDWTTNTTNLPSGSTAWPGIGANATSVSGKTVTFASSDLTSNSLYCFNFTTTLSSTGSAGNDKTGTLVTKDSSNTTIDSAIYAISVVSSNEINITASVDPQVSDLPITLESTTAGTQFPQNTTISYKITYGSNAAGTIPLTIQAEWSQGTIDGSPTPSVDILNYVVGSASNAYGSTAPVIDTINRTITWTIASFPGNTTGQTVTFSLKTNDSYTGSSLVHFTVLGRASSGTTVTPDQTVTRDYLYSPAPSATATPTSAPSTSTTTSTTTATPTPSAALKPQLSFLDVSIYTISDSEAKISITTNKDSTLTVAYGKSPALLNKTIKSLTLQTKSIITLADLEPDTDYYFKVTAKDTSGKEKVSDIFTFRTAVTSEAPSVDLLSLVIVSNNNVLLNPQAQVTAGESALKYAFVIPNSTVFEIHFALEKKTTIKTIQAIVTNKNVLGANTFDTQNAASNYVDLVETRPGIYTGRLLSKDPGNYELYVKIIDYNGNITLQKTTNIKVVERFRILEKGTKNPIEGARVLFYLYNPTTKIYELISPQILPIINPSFSLPDGTVNVVFPKGKYKAEVSALGYDQKTSEFAIDFDSGEYPAIYLTPQPFNIVNFLKYYTTTFMDGLNSSANYIRERAYSNRLFNFLTMLSLLAFVFLTFMSFSARTHVPLLYIPYFFIHKLRLIFVKNKPSFMFGKVVDEKTNLPISRVNVSIIDSKNNIMANLKTNRLGEFYYSKAYEKNYKIYVVKEGSIQKQSFDYLKSPMTLKVKEEKAVKRSYVQTFLLYTEDIFGILLEYMLISGLIIEIFLVFTFGFLRIAVFLIISTINAVLFSLFIYKPKNLEE